MPDASIRESKERVKTAIKNCGIEIASRKYIINLSPANIRKEGAVLDLAIAIGVLSSMNIVNSNKTINTIFLGELSLDGKLNKINGVLPICSKAAEKGIKRVILPKDNAKEAAIIPNIEVIGIENLYEVINYLNGNIYINPEKLSIVINENKESLIDFSDVKGQEYAKRALEVAAAGGHNCLMVGSPGVGKTMLAKRIPTILPDLSFEEALEITKIYSLSGKLENGKLIDIRPFRNPHYNITEKALLGGGKNPKPGEVSLAHLGVLFLDELLEFKKNTLEALRIPMENKQISISRVGINVKYPCDFMTVASMNPCPCGYYGSKIKECKCTNLQRNNYISKLSGPLKDRFDIYLNILPIKYNKLNDKEIETSKAIKERVNNARNIQKNRYKDFEIYSNSGLTPKLIEKFCYLDSSCRKLLNNSFSNMKLSMRAYTKILKVARTIADLDGKENIEEIHILEALQYRNLNERK